MSNTKQPTSAFYVNLLPFINFNLYIQLDSAANF